MRCLSRHDFADGEGEGGEDVAAPAHHHQVLRHEQTRRGHRNHRKVHHIQCHRWVQCLTFSPLRAAIVVTYFTYVSELYATLVDVGLRI